MSTAESVNGARHKTWQVNRVSFSTEFAVAFPNLGIAMGGKR